MKVSNVEGTEILKIKGVTVHLCTNGGTYTIGVVSGIDFEFKEIDKETYESLKKLKDTKGMGMFRR